jgi:hypothetical protein
VLTATRSTAQTDPVGSGVRWGPKQATGWPSCGAEALTAIASVTGGLEDTEPGFGARFNLTSCVGCHLQAIGLLALVARRSDDCGGASSGPPHRLRDLRNAGGVYRRRKAAGQLLARSSPQQSLQEHTTISAASIPGCGQMSPRGACPSNSATRFPGLWAVSDESPRRPGRPSPARVIPVRRTGVRRTSRWSAIRCPKNRSAR